MSVQSDLKWNSEQIVSFLNIYKPYRCLWDSSSEEYLSKRGKRQEVLEKLATELELNGLGVIDTNKLKCKIKSLKDSYRFELNKIKTSLTNGAESGDAVYKPKLRWFSVADDFLRRVVSGKKSSLDLDLPANHEEVDPVCSNSSRLETHGDTDPPISKNMIISTPRPSTNNYRLNTHPTARGSLQLQKSVKRSAPIENISSCRSAKSTRFEQNFDELESVVNISARDSDDEYEKYGRHIAAQLRALPLRSFIVLQHEINNLITTERLNVIDSESVPSTSEVNSSVENQSLKFGTETFEVIDIN